MVIGAISKTFGRVFGTRNERMLKVYHRRVALINAHEEQVRTLSDEQLRDKTEQFRERIADDERPADLLPEVLAVAREVMDRSVGIRNIFNPEAGFDPSKLPAPVRGEYDRIAAEAASMEPVEVEGCREPVPGWQRVTIPNAIYEAVRELYPKSRPPFRARPFDVQLIGGMVLGEGRIAEMKTGEGKTIVAPLACYVACVEHLQCHVVTVNDYLVQRDRDWVFPFYYHLGLTVGSIHPIEHPTYPQSPQDKMRAYECDVVYGTNSEFGFDYLRDNMKLSAAEQVQKRRDFCIIDEVDSILIDEARTPLIISGPAHEDAPQYEIADRIAAHLAQKQKDWDAADEKLRQANMRIAGLEGDIRNARDKSKVPAMREQLQQLRRDLPQIEAERDRHTQYYEVEPEKKASHLTHDGIAEAQKMAGVGSFYVGNNMDMPHLLENALRARVVYKRDKDYVVQNGEVIIVDENTGRLMVGRQWSDGLHQAVEAKENVKIKQETQTLATVTIQNFFKLYERLAGMTGTAVTEATEFMEIYKLDVVCIPTNVPVIRDDLNDLIFLAGKDKWNAILDDIKAKHDVGRPVLVGTTSVEKSEMLAELLHKKHGIHHEVLNAKQHDREAAIVAGAGDLGAVMIATNMAGRGTDIRLRPIDREALVHHWQMRNLLPRQAKADMSDEQLIALSYKHQASQTFGIRGKDLEALDAEQARLMLMHKWVGESTWTEPAKAEGMSAEQCEKLLDATPGFLQHRLAIYDHIEMMGGLHIIGTERHESRRIDNQLRGRAGRQGDRGSSRFFISMEDDLMKLFAGKATLAALSKLGMKEGDAIEHRWLTNSVGRAQRKVEERNYEIRKNLLEYDEVMEHQRHSFYGTRQEVLEGQGVTQLIFEYIGDAVEDAVTMYLGRDYVPTQVAEWCRQTLDVSIEPGKLHVEDLESLQDDIRSEARAELRSNIDVTIGEYMSNDMDPDDWDLKGLASWAMSRYQVDLKQSQLRQMNIDDVRDLLTEAALDQLERKELTGLDKFLDPLYAQKGLAEWAKNKFGLELDVEKYVDVEPEAAINRILERAREAYREREVTYPAQFIVDFTFQAAQQDGQWAANNLCTWVRQRYGVEWTPEEVKSAAGADLHTKITDLTRQWLHGGKLEALVDETVRGHKSDEALIEFCRTRFGQDLTIEELDKARGDEDDGVRDLLLEKGRAMLRAELSQLERFVLLQILDAAWKDHLYAMDQLKSSVGLRGFAEKDPRIEYKREGANLFAEMGRVVRDRVTDLIFRARLTPNVQMRSVYNEQAAAHQEAGSAMAQQGTADQQSDLAAADRAGAGDQREMSRRQERAARARAKAEARAERSTSNRPGKTRKKRSR